MDLVVEMLPVKERPAGERERESNWLRENDGACGFTCRRERGTASRLREREKNERQSEIF
jgi:hypothetical protein